MRSIQALALVVALLLCGPAHAAHAGGGGHGGGMASHSGSGGWHGGWHGGGYHPGYFRGGGPHVFIGGGFGYPFFWPSYYYGWGPAWPYAYPYGYPYPYPGTYPESSPPPDTATQTPPSDVGTPPPDTAEAQGDSQDIGTYGLIQIRGVPDGGSVFLDGRFWLVAHGLDGRWLALPEGRHTITVRMTGYRESTTSVDVVPGSNRVVQVQRMMRGADAGEPTS